MTPKEKAVELFKKMYQVHSVAASDITKYFAKQCALIAVDELISALYKWDDDAQTNREEYYYWQEVKQEIEKL